jgi:hypothetical protein
MKNSNYFIGIRTRDLPACITVPQPTPLTVRNNPVSWFILNSEQASINSLVVRFSLTSQPIRIVQLLTL